MAKVNKKKRIRKPEKPIDKNEVIFPNDTELYRKIFKNKKKPAEFENYAFFLSLENDQREEIFGYTTAKDFAAAKKLHPGTLSEWKNSNLIWRIRDRYLKRFKRYTPDILAALARTAMKRGDAGEVKAWMQLIEGWSDKVDITSKGKRITGFKIIEHAPRSPGDPSIYSEPKGD